MTEQRTKAQNKAMHLFFEHTAQALNDAGLDMRAVLRDDVEIEWTQETVKEYLWKSQQ